MVRFTIYYFAGYDQVVSWWKVEANVSFAARRVKL